MNCSNFDILYELSKSSRNTLKRNHSSNHSNRNNLWIYQPDFVINNSTKYPNSTRKTTHEYHLRIVSILSKICHIPTKWRYMEEVCIGSFIHLTMNFCLLEDILKKTNLPHPLFIKRGEKCSHLTKGNAKGRGI